MNLIKKLIISILAINFVAFGAASFLSSSLGGDSITLISEGIHKFLSINYFYTGLLFNGIFISIALIVNRKALGMGTFLYAISCGIFVDLYLLLFSNILDEPIGFTTRLILIFLGQISLCFGFSVLMEMNSGMSGLDATLNFLEEKFNIPYRLSKTLVDIFFCFLGYYLGGVFGIGSIFAMFTGGTIISYMNNGIKKRIKIE